MIPSAIARRFRRLVGERRSPIERMSDFVKRLHRKPAIPISPLNLEA